MLITRMAPWVLLILVSSFIFFMYSHYMSAPVFGAADSEKLDRMGSVTHRPASTGAVGMSGGTHGRTPGHRPAPRLEQSPADRDVHVTRETFSSGNAGITVEHYQLSGDRPRPAILVLHGAGGPVSPFLPYEQYARDLAQQGYGIFFVHYFEKTGSTPGALWTGGRQHLEDNFPAWITAVQDAISFVQGLPTTNSRRVGLLGYSLGSYLALSVATHDTRIAAVAEFFGGLPEQFSGQAAKLPPVLILHGDADPVVPVSEAYNLERQLKSAGRTMEMQIYKGSGHGFYGEVAKDAAGRMLRFFQQYLKG